MFFPFSDHSDRVVFQRFRLHMLTQEKSEWPVWKVQVQSQYCYNSVVLYIAAPYFALRDLQSRCMTARIWLSRKNVESKVKTKNNVFDIHLLCLFVCFGTL